MTEQFAFTWPMHQLDAQDRYVFLSDAHIYITGEFDNWTKSILLKPNYKEQRYETLLPIQNFNDQGKFIFKFYFEDTDTWKCNPLYPIDTDKNGNQNNYITGFHLIKQAEELELVKREKHQYSECEAINEEIVNELEVESSPLNNETNQASVDGNGREKDIDKQDNSAKQLAGVTLFPTENKTLETAIVENREPIPVLVHSIDTGNEVVANEPIEAFIFKGDGNNDNNSTEEKEKGNYSSIEEKQVGNIIDNEHKGEQVVPGDVITNSKDLNDIDDIPTENRRKFKIKRKIKKNKRTGERIIVAQEIFELDQDDNIIATYKSMEEVRNGPVSNELEEPKERLYEIENVNDADTIGRSFSIVAPNNGDSKEDIAENITENKGVQEEPLLFKDEERQKEMELGGSSIKEEVPEKKEEILVVLKDGHTDNTEENMVENNNKITEKSGLNEESVNDRYDGVSNTSVLDKSVLKEEFMQNPKRESQEVNSTSGRNNYTNQGTGLLEGSYMIENKENDKDAKEVNNKEILLKQAGDEIKENVESSSKKNLPTHKTVSIGISSEPTVNAPDKPKKSGILRKLKKKFF